MTEAIRPMTPTEVSAYKQGVKDAKAGLPPAPKPVTTSDTWPFYELNAYKRGYENGPGEPDDE